MTAAATAMHRWVFPVPVPPIKIALRLASMKVPVASFANLPFIDRRLGKDKAVDIFEDRELGAADTIADRSSLPVDAFGADQAGDERIDLVAPGKTFAG